MCREVEHHARFDPLEGDASDHEAVLFGGWTAEFGLDRARGDENRIVPLDRVGVTKCELMRQG